MNSEINKAIEGFFARLSEQSFILRTDKVWPDAALSQLKDRDETFRKQFWLELEKVFTEKEKTLGHLHKGQIYWRLAIIFLGEGNLTKAIDYLGLASAEDRQRGDTFSAAMGLLSILKPLVHRFKGSTWKFDDQIMEFYETLSNGEKREFANRLVSTHDQVASGRMTVIKDEFFHFIADETTRRVIHDNYIEIKDILSGSPLKTYLSCLFSAGSFLEGMLDDLFSRDDQKIWKLFHNNENIQKDVRGDSKLRATDYDDGMTLGSKISALRLWTMHATSPVPKVAILQMLIIGEYRDLIHPRRRRAFAFEANGYVASFIFTSISQVASHWWPENVQKELGATKSEDR